MNKGKYVFAQIFELIPHHQFHKCVEKHQGNKKVTSLSCWEQFLCMSFGQLTRKESLRSIVTCINAHKPKLYHLGFSSPIARTTLLDANENRSWKIYYDFAQILIPIVRKLYINDQKFKFEIDNPLYAIDSTTIDVCLNVFKWAKYKKKKGAVKVHTQLDLRGNIPTFIVITNGKVHDIHILDKVDFEVGAFYLMDRAYVDFKRLFKINLTPAFFITRAKSNIKYRRVKSNIVDKTTRVRSDQIIKLTSPKTKQKYPEKLRRICYYNEKKKKHYFFLTNNFTLDAKSIADLYRLRWKIEIFFKWIKQNIVIKKFYGRSENAVKTQIWIATCVYLLVAILKKKLDVKLELFQILQIVDDSLFDKTPLKQLLSVGGCQDFDVGTLRQLSIWDI
jgi:hypothetical protein